MKTLIIALIILCSVNLNGQNTIKNMTQWNLDGFVNDCLKELKIDSITVILIPRNDLINEKYEGLMIRNNINIFSIMVYHYIDYNEACLIIAHELVHVQQMVSGSLQITQTNTIGFNGKIYKANTNDEILNPHEVEAHRIGMKLFSKNKRVVYSPPIADAKRY